MAIHQVGKTAADQWFFEPSIDVAGASKTKRWERWIVFIAS